MSSHNHTNYNGFHNNSNFPTGESVHVEEPVMEEVEAVAEADFVGYVEEIEEIEENEPVVEATHDNGLAYTSARVWLRETPSVAGATLRVVDNETQINLLDENTPGWWHVELTDDPSITGYIMGAYVTEPQQVTR